MGVPIKLNALLATFAAMTVSVSAYSNGYVFGCVNVPGGTGSPHVSAFKTTASPYSFQLLKNNVPVSTKGSEKNVGGADYSYVKHYMMPA